MIKIVSRWDSSKVIFECDAATLREAVLRAVAARANLSDAYLSGADLSRADLSGADLSRANLSGAYLSGANLSDAYLSGADLSRADLSGADLSRANLSGADLSRADLSRANLSDAYLSRANLSRADLSGARNVPTISESLRTTSAPRIEHIHTRIQQAVDAPGHRLEMGAWHSCNTEHCRGGWTVHLAGEAGYALEKQIGPAHAAAEIYRASGARAPHFYATNERALEDIRRSAWIEGVANRIAMAHELNGRP